MGAQGSAQPQQAASLPPQRSAAPAPRPSIDRGYPSSRPSSSLRPGGANASSRSVVRENDPDDPFRENRRPGGGFAPLPASSFQQFNRHGTEDKAQELCSILRNLEGQLEDPNDFVMIGKTYRGLSEWTWEHSQDSDFSEVLVLLAPDSMYPAWRRQALEEAYMLFYEDCAKQGNPKALDYLPEPPTSKEIGYRPLPEALLDPKTTRGAAFSNTYEAGSACCVRRRWDYDVIRNGPRPKPGEKRAAGRKIVAKDNSERYCACAADPMTRLVQAFTPESFCCGRDRKAVADAASGVPGAGGKGGRDEPQWPPPGGSNGRSSGTAANQPSASAKLKMKPASSSHRNETFPSPPGNPEGINAIATAMGASLARQDDDVPELGSGRRERAEQKLFQEEDPDKRALTL